jgi:E3 ubiquitin-protein ligase synoviolin
MLLYFLFFSVVMAYIGRPLHLIRQMYYTYARFVRRVKAIGNWRRATRNLNERFPAVTGAELRALDADDVCIICREAIDTGKRLPCGHVLHVDCLRDWLQRKQVSGDVVCVCVCVCVCVRACVRACVHALTST